MTFFVDIIYLSNGLFNVFLFSNTRPDLLPHDPSKTEVALDEVVIEVRPPQIEGLGEVNVLTDEVQRRHDLPTNTHGVQLDWEGGETVRFPVGVTYENLRRPSMDSLGWLLFFPSHNIM